MSDYARFIAARIVKVVGNSFKFLCLLIHIVAPKKRFAIPHRSAPLFAGRTPYVIPKIIWQTNYTDRVTLAVYLNYLFNRLMAPTYEYRFMDTAERAAFIGQYCTAEVAEAYGRLQIGAAQADLWRLLVLRQFGGVYIDIDAHVVWPVGFIVAPRDEELYLEHKDGSLTNYFIASRPGNPHLDVVIDAILANIRRPTTNDVAELTGPALFALLRARNVPATYYKFTCYQGSFTNEFFQYLDHPHGKWIYAQNDIAIVRRCR